MALFGTQRDAKFLASINAELLNSIIDTEIEFFKLVVELLMLLFQIVLG